MGKRKMKNRNKQTENRNVEDGGKQISEVNSMNEENARKREKTDVPVNGMERMQNGGERVQNGGNEAFGLGYAQATLDGGNGKHKIHLLSIIGEVEGHENLSGNTKVTKYDQILPRLAELEDDDSVEGLLVLLNTSGGDVDAGLAIAEMIASLSMPTVSLVLGGSHSIGVPLAVSTDHSFIVQTGTMMVHPVRMSGTVIGASQTYEYFEMIQDRILTFVSDHAQIAYDQVKQLMLNTEMLTRDLGTVLVGSETVKAGLIDEVGGIREALGYLYRKIEEGWASCIS